MTSSRRFETATGSAAGAGTANTSAKRTAASGGQTRATGNRLSEVGVRCRRVIVHAGAGKPHPYLPPTSPQREQGLGFTLARAAGWSERAGGEGGSGTSCP